jgi:hypothetical protein
MREDFPEHSAKVIFSQLLLTMAARGHVSAALEAWREEQRAQITQVLRNSVVGMPFGQRIRNLRTVLGWSQRKSAEHFEVSVRSLIRHEREPSALRPIASCVFSEPAATQRRFKTHYTGKS